MSNTVHGLARYASRVHLSPTRSKLVGVGCGCQCGPTAAWRPRASPSHPVVGHPAASQRGRRRIKLATVFTTATEQTAAEPGAGLVTVGRATTIVVAYCPG